jgi:structural maintenance of chromosome 4
MAACRSGKPLHGCGLMGRLGDLATIDAKYDVAISTACGSLDHLVVANADGASKAIQYLKQHNIGRASFIVVDSIRAKCEKAMEVPFNTPSKVCAIYIQRNNNNNNGCLQFD